MPKYPRLLIRSVTAQWNLEPEKFDGAATVLTYPKVREDAAGAEDVVVVVVVGAAVVVGPVVEGAPVVVGAAVERGPVVVVVVVAAV